MSGLADQQHPADLPNVLNEAGFVPWSGISSVLLLVAVGILMTTVMQSSTAAIAVTLSALYAGAVSLDQAMALVIGQNIGTATSSAVAAIGASGTAKRLAVAYIAFKLIAALIALIVFPFVTPLIVRVSQSVDSVTISAARLSVAPQHHTVRAKARIFHAQEEVETAFHAGELDSDLVAMVEEGKIPGSS
jgi:phosphate:Na+ symporter